MRFLGLGLEHPVPDAKTVWLFREQLTRAGGIEGLFATFDAALRLKGTWPCQDRSLTPRSLRHHASAAMHAVARLEQREPPPAAASGEAFRIEGEPEVPARANPKSRIALDRPMHGSE